jgi:thiamine kinase-like enzyme
VECPELVEQCQPDIESVFHNNTVVNKLLEILNKTPMVLCHNDCHLGNILSSSKGDFIIDFEFSQFNYMGYDLGNFLNEWATEYGAVFEIGQEMD